MYAESAAGFDKVTQKAMQTPAAKRTPLQCQLADMASRQVERKLTRTRMTRR